MFSECLEPWIEIYGCVYVCFQASLVRERLVHVYQFKMAKLLFKKMLESETLEHNFGLSICF